MIVDDEPGLLEILERALRRGGYDVVTHGSGADAVLDMVDGRLPDVLVTDVLMPMVGGVELLDYVRGRHPELPVIVMTGHRGHHLDVPVLEKPFQMATLIEQIERLTATRTPSTPSDR